MSATTIVWIVDGEPRTGTVASLALSLAAAQRCGEEDAIDRIAYVVRTAVRWHPGGGGFYEAPELAARAIRESGSPFDEDDFATVTVSVDGVAETGSYRIDGRS